jgi:DNA-binding NarL/FixJ family response regulator
MNIMPPIKILIADDHDLFRDGLKTLIKDETSVQLVGEACNGKQLIGLTRMLKPDIVITDLIMPEIDGVQAIREIADMNLDTKCIALSNFDSDALIMEALEGGASGYILKNSQRGEILNAIQTVYDGQNYFCKTTSAKFFRNIAKSKYTKKVKVNHDLFSEREKEIIKLICMEKTSDEMSKILFMSSRTIEGYRARILKKMNVKNSLGVLIYALKNGLFSIE